MTDDAERWTDPVVVTFRLPSDIASETASVVGDFNEWDPQQGVMERDDSGAFSCSLTIRPGRTYQYRYLLDGDRWTNDWAANSFVPNMFGGEDSLLDLSDHVLDGADPTPVRAQVDIDLDD
jgi:1,4-alpha-glucan branching enzyme